MGSLREAGAELLRMESLGGGSGLAFDDRKTSSGRPIAIDVYSGEIVDDLVLRYRDVDPRPHVDLGGAPREPSATVSLEGDSLRALRGVWGDYHGADHILQVSIETASGATHGPFGVARETSTSGCAFRETPR